MKFIWILLASVIFGTFSACQTVQQNTQNSALNASANAKRYDLKGKVLSVDAANGKAKILHEEIPNYMASMTMDFPFKDVSWLKEIKPNDQVIATLVVDSANDAAPYWLEDVKIISSPAGANGEPQSAFEGEKSLGKQVPDFDLLNQDGKPFSFSSLRGKAAAVTFIYTRCPLPDQCPLMSINFSDLAKQTANDAELKDKLRFVSISFDPEFDKPEVLKNYGAGYFGKNAKADFQTWQLVTGSRQEIMKTAEFFGMQVLPEENQIVHTLVTAVIAPDGKISKVFTGNHWTKEQLWEALKETAK